jgi:hypothetical protein
MCEELDYYSNLDRTRFVVTVLYTLFNPLQRISINFSHNIERKDESSVDKINVRLRFF